MFYIYALKSRAKNYIYIGLTNNLQRRVKEHNSGKEKTTRSYNPFELIYSEEFKTRTEARNREKYLKSGCGKEWIKQKFI